MIISRKWQRVSLVVDRFFWHLKKHDNVLQMFKSKLPFQNSKGDIKRDLVCIKLFLKDKQPGHKWEGGNGT